MERRERYRGNPDLYKAFLYSRNQAGPPYKLVGPNHSGQRPLYQNSQVIKMQCCCSCSSGWDGTGSHQILEFESLGFLENHVFLPTKQVETNIF